MKKIIIYTLALLGWSHLAVSQNIGINATGATPNASAMLDVSSTNSGLLIPRVALTAINVAGPIATPATSLLVYNTATAGTSPNNVVPGFYYWNGTTWIALMTSAGANGAWNLSGNVGTNVATNFMGTTDDRQVIFKSNNQSYAELGSRQTLGLVQDYPDYTDGAEKVTLLRSSLQFEAAAANFYKPKFYTDANGNFRMKGSSAGTDLFEFGATGADNNGGLDFVIGDDGDEPIVFKSYNYQSGTTEMMRLQNNRMSLGSATFDGTNPEKLLINAGTTTSVNALYAKGSINNYLQINIQNQLAGNNASSDIIATADNGTETTNYIDMGINSSAYSGGVMGAANDGYLYNIGQNLLIGTGTASRSLIFVTGGTNQTNNERMRIDGTGNVGIATNAPAAKLDVDGNFKLGDNGSVLTGMIKGSVNINDNTANITQNNPRTFNVAVTGATVNGSVIVNPRAALQQGVVIAWARVSSNGTVTICFNNTSSTARAVGNITFDITVIQ